MKRLFVLFLITVLLLGLLPLPYVYAEETEGTGLTEPLTVEEDSQTNEEETPTEPSEEDSVPTEQEIESTEEEENETWSVTEDGVLTISGNGKLTKRIQDKELAIPDENIKKLVVEEGITALPASAFESMKGLKTVVLADSITEIGERAFLDCEVLETVKLPENLETIGERAFQNNYTLKAINIPDSVVTIGNYAFDHCESAKTLVLGKNVKSIGDYAFYECKGIQTLTIPDSVTQVGSHAFHSLRNLKSFTIGKGITKISDSMFRYCYNLETIVIPDHITEVGDYAFCACGGAEKIVIPDSVEKIGKEAFSCCGSIKELYYPASVKFVGEDQFREMNYITVYYGGSKETWQSFGVKSDLVTMHYNVKDPDTHKTLKSHTPATCTKIGNKVYGCACGYTWTVRLDKSHNWVHTKTVAANCGEGGYDLQTCSKCKTTQRVNFTPIDRTIKHKTVDGKCTVCGKYLFAWDPEIKTTWRGDGKPGVTATANGYRYNREIYRSKTQKGPYTLIGTKDKFDTSFFYDGTAKPGESYYYKVRFVNDDGYVSKFSAVRKMTCKTDAPNNISEKTDPATGKPVLTWKAVEGAKKYNIYRATSPDGKFKKIKTVTGTTYTDKSAAAGKTYYYQYQTVGAVSGTNSDKCIAEEGERGVKAICAQPKVTVSVSATTGKATLKWKKVSGAVRYDIYRSTNEEDGYVKITSVKGISYTDKAATANQLYFYKVKAVAKNSTYSSADMKPVKAQSTYPQLTFKTAADTVTGKPRLTWTEIAGADAYQIYRSTSKKGTYAAIGTAEEGAFLDKTAAAGKTYYYKVKAVGDNGVSGALGKYKSIRAKAAQPQIQVTLDENGKPVVSWETVEGAVKYEVYRATSLKGKYSKQATVKTNVYVNTSAKNGKTYYYKVVAVPSSSKAKSAASAIVPITLP